MHWLNKLVLLFLLCFATNNLFSQEKDHGIDIGQNAFDEVLLSIIHEDAIQIQRERQEQICDYADLPGTFWVIEDRMTNPFKNPLVFFGMMFIGDDIVVVVNVRPIGGENGISHLIFLESIAATKRYKIVDNKIIIIQNSLEGYLQDHYLFFGSEKLGYAKYRLEQNFIPLQNDIEERGHNRQIPRTPNQQ
jgi:hypothetical protein